MVAVTAAGILLSYRVLDSGDMQGLWTYVFRVIGALLAVLGVVIWFISATRSGMDDNIANNQLKTDGIYAWTRNPMYSGWWIALFGISLLWHNGWLVLTALINWIIMTIVIKNTEERWLLNLYGKEYEDYMKRVNRFVPWRRRKKEN